MGLSLVCFQVQSALAFHVRAHAVPGKTGLLRDIVQRQDHAFFHIPQAADVKVAIRVVDQTGQVGGAFAHHVLYVLFGLIGDARESEVYIDKIMRQIFQRAEIGQFFARTRAEEQQ